MSIEFKILSLSYYHNPDVLYLSRDLLGKFLISSINGEETGGMIIETEAYCGPLDRASHAYNNRKTKRNAVMYEQGGISYVYQCYGIHALFNVVTNTKDNPHAILIRALKPLIGLETMLRRRNKIKCDRTLTGGPGTLTQALGITTQYSGLPLNQPPIWIEDRGIIVKENDILIGPRVGIDYAGEDVDKPWRFRI